MDPVVSDLKVGFENEVVKEYKRFQVMLLSSFGKLKGVEVRETDPVTSSDFRNDSGTSRFFVLI